MMSPQQQSELYSAASMIADTILSAIEVVVSASVPEDVRCRLPWEVQRNDSPILNPADFEAGPVPRVRQLVPYDWQSA